MFIIRDGLVDRHARQLSTENNTNNGNSAQRKKKVPCKACCNLGCCLCLAMTNLIAGTVILAIGLTASNGADWIPDKAAVIAGGVILGVGVSLILMVVIGYTIKMLKIRQERKLRKVTMSTCSHRLIMSLHNYEREALQGLVERKQENSKSGQQGINRKSSGNSLQKVARQNSTHMIDAPVIKSNYNTSNSRPGTVRQNSNTSLRELRQNSRQGSRGHVLRGTDIHVEIT
ncbi:uncharacterized protein LOC106174806 [Lingula anatina]|uniref:Uncharacterized protein LOC106174806 n=1 Tax=Lingula anatina TaxID=7574 RepID=A0A1S3JNM3_LINAN|nr:uncharacterized protein LOC106174806 [Lingula anatina]|eukprot:XP_013411952.1 uncharacterized protein LOC106174806 [Lingula anatina]